jgi:hypothetical protein
MKFVDQFVAFSILRGILYNGANHSRYRGWFLLKIFYIYQTKVLKFSKNLGATLNSRHQKGDVNQVPFSGSINIRHHSTEFSCNGDLMPQICAPLCQTLLFRCKTMKTVFYVRFSQQWLWRVPSASMWCHIMCWKCTSVWGGPVNSIFRIGSTTWHCIQGDCNIPTTFTVLSS